MKKNKILLLCVVLVCVILTVAIVCLVVFTEKSNEGDSTDSDGTSETLSPDGPPDYHLSEFDDALIAYLCLNGYDSSDFVISPVAFRAALCIAAAGAQGNTRTELVTAAGFSGSDAFKSWYSRLKKAEATFAAQNSGSGSFLVASSVWSNGDMLGKFTDSYIASVKTGYDADAYSRGSDELTQAINDWINQKTDGRVSGIADDLAGASSVLVGALRLQAAWENAFPEALTREGIFVDRAGNEKTVDFMEQTGEYLYAEENGTQIIVIPMEGDLSFVCFLGNRIDRFDKLEKLQNEKVRVVLPRFELESAFDARDLLGFLLSRGIHDAIDERMANFYNMCQGSEWFLQEILQKTRIAAGEGGIGSAPAGVTSGAGKTRDGTEVREFVADSPFSFAIFSDFGTSDQNMLIYGQLMNGGK